MELRISRRTLRRVTRGLVVIGVVLAVTVGLYAIGLRLTPRTERGRPILYSPAARIDRAEIAGAEHLLRGSQQDFLRCGGEVEQRG
jgi:hypothetical protein